VNWVFGSRLGCTIFICETDGSLNCSALVLKACGHYRTECLKNHEKKREKVEKEEEPKQNKQDKQLDIHVPVHHDVIYGNDQQDATVYDNLLFLGCSTCFERYFRSSSGAS